MKVLKFGGSSVGNPERIRAVKKIIASEQLPLVLVVSAFQGVTDSLKSISEAAAGHDPGYNPKLDELIRKHRTVCSELLDGDTLDSTLSGIDLLFQELIETLSGLYPT